MDNSVEETEPSNNKKKAPYNQKLKLKRERELKGWSQAEVAEKIGAQNNLVTRWEIGAVFPSPYYRQKLCQLFEKNAEELGLIKGTSTDATREKRSPAIMVETETNEKYEPVPVSTRENEVVTMGQASAHDMTGLRDQQHAASPSSSWNIAWDANAGGPISLGRFPFSKNTWPHGRWWLVIIIIMLLLSGIGVLSALSPLLRGTAPSTSSLKGTAPSTSSLKGTGSASGQTYQTYPIKLSDPLDKQDPQSQWSTGKVCTFQYGAYHVQSLGTNYCMENELILVDVEYQINVTLVKGPQAGIAFRGVGNNQLYYFSIDAQGHYEVDLLNAPTLPLRQLSGSSSALGQGYGQVNTLGVVIKGAAVNFLINQQPVASMKDTIFHYGHVGICVGSYLNDAESQETIATYQNAIIQGQVLSRL